MTRLLKSLDPFRLLNNLLHPDGEPCAFCGWKTRDPGQKWMQGAWYWWNGGVPIIHSPNEPPSLPIPKDKLISVQVRFPEGVQYCRRCMVKQAVKVLKHGSGQYVGEKMVRENN